MQISKSVSLKAENKTLHRYLLRLVVIDLVFKAAAADDLWDISPFDGEISAASPLKAWAWVRLPVLLGVCCRDIDYYSTRHDNERQARRPAAKTKPQVHS